MIQVFFCFAHAKMAANKCDKAKARRGEKKNHKIHKNGDESEDRDKERRAEKRKKKFDLLINIK